MSEFEKYIECTGLVEFSGWHFEKDECDEYLHEPTQIAAQIWREKESVINHQQSKIDQLEKKISNFKERINHAEKFINQIPCQSTWEAESRQDAMKALRNGKRFKEPKKLPHTHIFISNTCECGWTVDQEKALRGES